MFPTPWTVTVHHLDKSGVDEYGNDAETWTDIVQPVIGWGPASGLEVTDRSAMVERDLDLMVPPEFVAGALDEITVDGLRYEVVGAPMDWTRGPFDFAPGMTLMLKRTEG